MSLFFTLMWSSRTYTVASAAGDIATGCVGRAVRNASPHPSATNAAAHAAREGMGFTVGNCETGAFARIVR